MLYFNRKVFFIFKLFTIFLLIIACDRPDKERLLNFKKIVRLVSHKSFKYANIDSNKIIFRNSKLKIISKDKIPDPIFQSIKSEKILLIRKIRMGFMFTLSRAIDDEWGVIYSKSNLIDFEGLNWVERLDGSWFYFSTMIK